MTSLDLNEVEEDRFHKSFNISFAGTYASQFTIEEESMQIICGFPKAVMNVAAKSTTEVDLYLLEAFKKSYSDNTY